MSETPPPENDGSRIERWSSDLGIKVFELCRRAGIPESRRATVYRAVKAAAEGHPYPMRARDLLNQLEAYYNSQIAAVPPVTADGVGVPAEPFAAEAAAMQTQALVRLDIESLVDMTPDETNALARTIYDEMLAGFRSGEKPTRGRAVAVARAFLRGYRLGRRRPE